MPRVKVPRKSTAIDMTAMCDVAFLLLTFFILTAKTKTEEVIPVDPPASTVTKTVPDEDIATLVVGGKGKVFFGVAGFETRKNTLIEMGRVYKQSYTPTQIDRFAVTNSFGVPISQLASYLSLESSEDVKKFQQTGIPQDSVGESASELYNWIRQARIVTRNLHNKEMRVTIKGDAKEQYPTIQKIIAILQKQKVNRFSLITGLKGK